MTAVLVDTSVFVAFFRGQESSDFEDLLFKNLVVISPVVELELLQGIRKDEYRKLVRVLSGLIRLPFRKEVFSQSRVIIEAVKGKGLTIGLPDLLIAAEANAHSLPILSFDKVFQKLGSLGLIAMKL